jgi:hypothetical protein
MTHRRPASRTPQARYAGTCRPSASAMARSDYIVGIAGLVRYGTGCAATAGDIKQDAAMVRTVFPDLRVALVDQLRSGG